MKKILVITLVLLTLSVSTYAVNVSQEWENVYRLGWIAVPNSIQQTADGGYIVAGFSGMLDMTVLKLDTNGNVSWLHTYDYGLPVTIEQTTDGGYILAAGYPTAGYGNMRLVKLDNNGNISWQKAEDFPANLDVRHTYVRQTTDGNYIVAGTVGPEQWWQGERDFWIVKFDSFGNVLWQKTYGGSGEEDLSMAEETLCIQQTTDGGYIVTGPTQSFGAGSADFWVLKLESSGNISWQKTYGGQNWDQPYSIQETMDGGYIVAGAFLVIKLDPNGNIVWYKQYATNEGDILLRVTSIEQIADGGYIMTGGAVGADLKLFVMRIDTNGNPLWLKIYQEGVSGYVPCIRKTQDGGYIVAASTNDDTGWDYWILKLNSYGDIPGCNAIVDTEAMVLDYSIVEQDTSVTPQPTNTISFDTSYQPENPTVQISTICYYEDPNDMDGDGIENAIGSSMASSTFLDIGDNCPDIPNGPFLGTCVTGDTYRIGRSCIDETYCGTGGFCSMNQEDTNESGVGDACNLCESDFDCDQDVDGTDAGMFKLDFGRSLFENPCNNESQCHGDFDCDNDCDGTDAALFKVDFGRSSFNNPCPACEVGVWCNY